MVVKDSGKTAFLSLPKPLISKEFIVLAETEGFEPSIQV